MKFDINKLRFIHSAGDCEYDACVMSARIALDRLARGEDIGEATDQDDRYCPVLRRLLIDRNDSTEIGPELDSWAREAVTLPICKQSHETTVRRVEAIVRYALINVIPDMVLLDEKIGSTSERIYWADQIKSFKDVDSFAVITIYLTDLYKRFVDMLHATYRAILNLAHAAQCVSGALNGGLDCGILDEATDKVFKTVWNADIVFSSNAKAMRDGVKFSLLDHVDAMIKLALAITD